MEELLLNIEISGRVVADHSFLPPLAQRHCEGLNLYWADISIVSMSTENGKSACFRRLHAEDDRSET